MANQRKIGNPFNDETEQGPVIDEEQFNRIMDYIKACCNGSQQMGDKGYFIAPTIFADVDDNMRISKEEIFGPVLVIEKFSCLQRSARPLKRPTAPPTVSAALCSLGTHSPVLEVSNAVQAGTVWVNCTSLPPPPQRRARG